MRIRNYTLNAQDKRDVRRLYPEVVFDWKKIARQPAEKGEVCRRYRSRRRTPAAARSPRARQPFYVAYDPMTRTVYADEPPNARDAGALLDAVLSVDRRLMHLGQIGTVKTSHDGVPRPTASHALGFWRSQ